MKLSWDLHTISPPASQFKVLESIDASGNFEAIGTTKEAHFTLRNMRSASQHRIKVRAFNVCGYVESPVTLYSAATGYVEPI